QAKTFVDEAVAKCPLTKKPQVSTLARLVAGDARRRLDALRLIVQDVDAAKTVDARRTFLTELMTKTATFVQDYPSVTGVWSLRATVAVELDYPTVGWLAARHLRMAHLENNTDPNIRKLMAQLERKNWLIDKQPPRRNVGWNGDPLMVAAN